MSFPQWKGLWDWSMKYADGTQPSGFRPEDVDPQKMKWLDEALKHYMIDFSARMREIKSKLEKDTTTTTTSTAAASTGTGRRAAGGRGGDTGDQGAVAEDEEGAAGTDLEEREALLDELMDIVSSIDYARDLHKIGGLPVLLELLDSPQPSLRWRAAEVVATCVANNPPVQQWFLDGGVLPKLLELVAPSQPATVRTKSLLALSGLVRHFDAGLQVLRAAGGLAAVISCLASPDRRLSRKAMTTLAYMLGQRRSDCAAALADGALPPLAAALGAADGAAGVATCGDAEDSDLRQAALSALLQLASFPATWAAVRDAPGLRARLAALEAAHAQLAPEDAEAQAEELGALQRLGALLAAPAAPEAPPPDEGGGITAAEFEESGRDLTINVNAPTAGAGRGDAGAGAEDQGGAPVRVGDGGADGAARQGQGQGQGQPAEAAAPLLLGPP